MDYAFTAGRPNVARRQRIAYSSRKRPH